MNTFADKTVLSRSRAGTWWQYCLGLVAAIFILSATDCSAEAVIGDQPKPRGPRCYGTNLLNKDITPPDEPVVLAGSYTKTSQPYTETFTFTNGSLRYSVRRDNSPETVYTGRYQYTEEPNGRWPFIFLSEVLRGEGDSDVSRAQVYKLEYDTCGSGFSHRPTRLAWLADGRILIGATDSPASNIHYYQASSGIFITSIHFKPPFICQPSETLECSTFASLLGPAVPVPDTIRDITAGIAAGSARVFSTRDRELSFRPDNTFSYSRVEFDDWATGGTWERVKKEGVDHWRVIIPEDIRDTVSGGAASMFAQAYKIRWDRPESTSNPAHYRPGEVLWFTNNQVVISRWEPSAFSTPGVSFIGRKLRGAEYLIPQTSPTE